MYKKCQLSSCIISGKKDATLMYEATKSRPDIKFKKLLNLDTESEKLSIMLSLKLNVH